MKTASGCRSTNGCTPKYRDGFDGAAKMEAGPLKPTLPHSNDEDVRKSLRLNIWPFLSNAAKLRYSEVVHLNCTVAKTRRQSGRASARVFNPSAEIITGPNRSCPLMPQHVGTSCHVGPRVFRQRFGMLIMQAALRIDAENSACLTDEPLPFVRCGDPGFRQAALRRDLGDLRELGRRHEIELIGIAHPDATLERVLQFRQEVRAGKP